MSNLHWTLDLHHCGSNCTLYQCELRVTFPSLYGGSMEHFYTFCVECQPNIWDFEYFVLIWQQIIHKKTTNLESYKDWFILAELSVVWFISIEFSQKISLLIKSNFRLKGYSVILWYEVHFSLQIQILFHILKELSYTNLTSIGLLQKHNSFDKIAFLTFWCPGIRNYSTVFNG